MQVIVNNLLSYYQKEGTGPVILFLHGWGDSSLTFTPLVKELKKTHTCITLDLPGFGASQLPNAVWDIPAYATFVSEFLKKLGVKADVIVGHSNGGTVAMYGTSHKILNPKKLVLLASAGIRSEDSVKKSLYKAVAKTGRLLSRTLPKKTQQKLRRRLYEAAGSDILISPDLEETFKKVVSYDAEADAAKITQPTILIYTQDDTATPSRYGVKLHNAIKDSKLTILPDGGHFVHQTQSQAVLDLMKEHIK